MANIETIIQHNSLVKRLIAEGNLSEEYLKKIYRRLCKITHPDLKKQDSVEFIRLKAEYEEAKEHVGELKTYLIEKENTNVLGDGDIRRMFYASLKHYLAAGLDSMRIRIKPEIKKRNELILREVLYWAKLYKPSFIPVFLEYNRAYLRRFSEWQKRESLSKARRLFLFGFRESIRYEDTHSPRALYAARSYFSDCQSVLEILTPSAHGRAVAGFALWFSGELESLATAGLREE
jgi:hypothetical protein